MSTIYEKLKAADWDGELARPASLILLGMYLDRVRMNTTTYEDAEWFEWRFMGGERQHRDDTR